MPSILKHLFSRDRFRPETSTWNSEQIENDDFRAHFTYAADIAAEWVGAETPLSRSRILDFGCGDGVTPLALALRHEALEVHGVDVHDSFRFLAKSARQQLGLRRLPGNLHFRRVAPGASLANKFTVDAVVSWSVFEHVRRELLPGIFTDLYNSLRPGGVFFLQIDPLYYSPSGSHLQAFLDEPWVHLLHDDAEVVRQLEEKRPENAPGIARDMAFETKSFDEFKKFLLGEFRSLNQITADEVLDLGTSAGFEVRREGRTKTELVPPNTLLQTYDADRLTTCEIRVLFQRPG